MPQESSGSYKTKVERWTGVGQGEEVRALQGVAGQAAVQGVNRLNQALCGHIVTLIVKTK